MTSSALPRILVVDDEEAILETMTFTFQDDYEVHTASDPRRALEILDEHAPFAAVLTDQRMPHMSGVEFVSEVCRRHPATSRIVLTGFSDMAAILQAINDGHVYAYVTKPWEPDQLKQIVKQAVEHHQLTVENERLVADLSRANRFLEAVMDELDTGALAVDGAGAVQALNRPARDYLALEGDPRGLSLAEALAGEELAAVRQAALTADGHGDSAYQDVEVHHGDSVYRLRITARQLLDPSCEPIGRVILLREVSHEPLQRRFSELLGGLVRADGEMRESLQRAREALDGLRSELESSRIESAAMGEIAERLSRTATAVENWLDVDDALAREDYPDAQLLRDRMRVAMARWPIPEEVPGPILELARAVEEYYESGENPKRHVL